MTAGQADILGLFQVNSACILNEEDFILGKKMDFSGTFRMIILVIRKCFMNNGAFEDFYYKGHMLSCTEYSLSPTT